jgi:hypothetical protein
MSTGFPIGTAAAEVAIRNRIRNLRGHRIAIRQAMPASSVPAVSGPRDIRRAHAANRQG